MRETKKLALSALLVALGTVFMMLGSFVEVLDLTVCALANKSFNGIHAPCLSFSI